MATGSSARPCLSRDGAGNRARTFCRLPAACPPSQAAVPPLRVPRSELPGSRQRVTCWETGFHKREASFREGAYVLISVSPNPVRSTSKNHPRVCHGKRLLPVIGYCRPASRIALTPLPPSVDLFESCWFSSPKRPIGKIVHLPLRKVGEVSFVLHLRFGLGSREAHICHLRGDSSR